MQRVFARHLWVYRFFFFFKFNFNSFLHLCFVLVSKLVAGALKPCQLLRVEEGTHSHVGVARKQLKGHTKVKQWRLEMEGYDDSKETPQDFLKHFISLRLLSPLSSEAKIKFLAAEALRGVGCLAR